MSKIRLLENGTYSIDFIKKIGGKRIHISKRGYISIEDANKDIPTLIKKRISKLKKIDNNSTFADFFNEYIKYRSQIISGSTKASIRSIYNVVLYRYSDIKVSEVLSIHNIISLYKNIIERKDVGDKWKNRVISELRHIIDYGYLCKYIDIDNLNDDKAVLINIPLIKKEKEKEYYSPYQIKRFLSIIDDEEDKSMFTIFIYLGARISEFLGLTWDCFDIKNKNIEIKQQITYLNKGKAILIDKLKTKESYRKCKLSPTTYEILLNRYNNSSTGYIFPKDKYHIKEPISKTTLRRKMIRYMKKAKLPLISPHGFRHSKASQFMSVCKNMEEVKAAAKFMGHSATMLMETYAHSEEKTIDILIKRME